VRTIARKRQADPNAPHVVICGAGFGGLAGIKTLTRAGLRGVDDLVAAAGPDPAVLRDLVDGARSLCSDALQAIYTF